MPAIWVDVKATRFCINGLDAINIADDFNKFVDESRIDFEIINKIDQFHKSDISVISSSSDFH